MHLKKTHGLKMNESANKGALLTPKEANEFAFDDFMFDGQSKERGWEP